MTMAGDITLKIDNTSSTEALYNAFGSKKMTGFGSRMEASRRPFASAGPLGITTYTTGLKRSILIFYKE
jgi:hypothetical protein